MCFVSKSCDLMPELASYTRDCLSQGFWHTSLFRGWTIVDWFLSGLVSHGKDKHEMAESEGGRNIDKECPIAAVNKPCTKEAIAKLYLGP